VAYGEIPRAVTGPEVSEDAVGRLAGGWTIFDLKIAPEVFDEVAAELGRTLEHLRVPEGEREEVMAAFNGWKNEVTAGSKPGAVNWRRWR
jgi:hypothetical protein